MQRVLIDGVLGPDSLEIECPCSDLLQVNHSRPSRAQFDRMSSGVFVPNGTINRFYINYTTHGQGEVIIK